MLGCFWVKACGIIISASGRRSVRDVCKTAYGRLRKLSKEFKLEKGCIYPIESDDETGKADPISEQGEDSETDE
jgi:hypothetical protein